MNEELVRFFCGGEDRKGHTQIEYLTCSDKYLEHTHDVIQWLFPTRRPSDHVKNSPLLDDETITILKMPQMRTKILLSYNRFWDFYRLDEVFFGNLNGSKISSYGSYNHNYKRITRILDCLSTLEMKEAKWMLKYLLLIPNVPTKVLAHWIAVTK